MLRLARQRAWKSLPSPVRGSLWLLTLVFATLLFRGAADAQSPSTAYRDTVLAIQDRIQKGELADATVLLTSAFKRYPSDGGLENLRGVVEIQQGHVAPAAAAFAKAIQNDPGLVSAYLNLGRIDMQTADVDARKREAALHLYESVLRLDRTNTEAGYHVALLLMWAQKYALSLEQIDHLEGGSRHQAEIEALACADHIALGPKDTADGAAASLVALADLTEEDATAILPALRAARRGDVIERLFLAVDAHHPLSPAGLRILGLAQEAEGKQTEARTTLEQAFAANETTDTPLLDLARIDLAENNYQGALGYLAHARALQPGDPALSYEYGWICLKMNLINEARKAFSEAVQLAPDNPDYNLAMGTMTTAPGGLPYLQRFHELRPGDAAGDLALGGAYYQASDFDKAMPWLNLAARSPATAAMAHYVMGKILSQQGHYDEAITQLSESAALTPDRSEVLADLGEAYMQHGQYPEAERYLDRAVALDPNSYAANLALLQLYSRTKDPRRDAQSQRFASIRDKTEEQYRDAMRVIEARPLAIAINNP